MAFNFCDLSADANWSRVSPILGPTSHIYSGQFVRPESAQRNLLQRHESMRGYAYHNSHWTLITIITWQRESSALRTEDGARQDRAAENSFWRIFAIPDEEHVTDVAGKKRRSPIMAAAVWSKELPNFFELFPLIHRTDGYQKEITPHFAQVAVFECLHWTGQEHIIYYDASWYRKTSLWTLVEMGYHFIRWSKHELDNYELWNSQINRVQFSK